MRFVVVIAIVGLIGAVPVSAAELPSRKPGLWEIKMSFENRNVPAQTLKQCVDPATDKLMQMGAASYPQSTCSKRDVQRSGNTTTIESICTIAGKTMHARVVITGSLDSAYIMTMTSEGEAIPGGKTRMTMSATWLGPCTPGDRRAQ
ncbi:MAG: DUF3617 family protein [Xanthobacteraceae bacterium]|nr:DUF3617 family protein [Xanthobacteraceae bacterium]